MLLDSVLILGGLAVFVALSLYFLHLWPGAAAHADGIGFLGSMALLLPIAATEALKWRKKRLDDRIAAAMFADPDVQRRFEERSQAIGRVIATFTGWHAWLYVLGAYALALAFGLKMSVGLHGY